MRDAWRTARGVRAVAAHLLRRPRPPRRHGPPLWRNSCGRATSSSMSARMWATASPPSAGSARAWSRSSRSRRWSRTLQLLYGRDRAVAIEPVAVGAREPARSSCKLNIDNPTVSTASDAFVRAADGAPGWEGQAWTETIAVPLTTLDALIARHGVPAFIKIDVEGFEAEALAGLAQPVPALSFEFTTIQRDVAAACIARCARSAFAATMRRSAKARPSSHAAGRRSRRSHAGSASCRTRPIPATSTQQPTDTHGNTILLHVY